jgi:hypothetical protein
MENLAGGTLLALPVILIRRQASARQPATTGASSMTTQRTRSGRACATIRLSMPPSEWPTRITGSS